MTSLSMIGILLACCDFFLALVLDDDSIFACISFCLSASFCCNVLVGVVTVAVGIL